MAPPTLAGAIGMSGPTVFLAERYDVRLRGRDVFVAFLPPLGLLLIWADIRDRKAANHS